MSTWTSRVCALAFAFAGSLIFGRATALEPIVFAVNTTEDGVDAEPGNGKCSTTLTPTPPYTCTLRAAIMEANRTPNAGATITLPAGTYTLAIDPHDTDDETNGDLNLSVPPGYTPGPTTIDGDGAATTIIDANGKDRVLSVAGTRTVTITGVTFRNGLTTGPGGGIASVGTLTLTDITLSNNAAGAEGGGIHNALGTLQVNVGRFTGNTASAGGGIWSTGFVQVANSTFDGNIVTGKGGGIYSEGSLGLLFDVLSGNKAGVSSSGGGIYTKTHVDVIATALTGNSARDGGGILADIGGSLSLQRCSLSGNIASVSGGGISSQSTEMTQSTISGNFALDGAGVYNYGFLSITNSTISSNNADSYGGGIYNNGNAYVYNSTIFFNQANADTNLFATGGGFYNGSGHSFFLRNSVVAGNYLLNSPIYDDCSGVVDTNGRNKYWVPGGGESCTIVQHSPGSDTLLASLTELGPLQNNGGFTQTHALVPPSNMIDGAESTKGCIGYGDVALTEDQRGFPRSSGARCDIGAFEYPNTIFADGFQ